MGQKKLKRFSEIKEFPNVLEFPQGMKGNWNDFFKNENTITLELACGKGEYAVGLGRLYPDQNFIGVDIKGNRIWRGAKTALDENLLNVAFLRAEIDRISEYFAAGEVSEIWLTFPDPQLQLSRIKKRLTHPRFLRLYKQFLKPEGLLHLKTDSPDLYNFTKTVINLYALDLLVGCDDLYRGTGRDKALSIKTHYESLNIAGSNKVHYLRFRINNNLPPEKDAALKNLFRAEQLD